MIKPTGINTKLHIAGSLLSFIIIGVIVLTVLMNERSKKDSLIINIAGKQRMLTQKMSKEIFYIKQKQGDDYRDLNSAISLFEDNLQDLIHGNEAKGIYPPQNEKIDSKLQKVQALWKPFRAELVRVQKLSRKVLPKLEVLTQRTTTLLEKSDKIVKAMVKADMDGIFIDLSGRQRMLSQRMGLFLERYLRTDNKEDYLLFQDARELYNKTIQDFLESKRVKAIEDVYRISQETYAYWQKHQTYMDEILQAQVEISQSLKYIYEENIKLLNTMDTAVWLFTEHSEKKNELFVKFQYISLVVALIIILYAFILSREIMHHINEFVKATKALDKGDISEITHESIAVDEDSEDELKEASNYISNFVQKVNVAMSHSDDAIQKAESAIEELQNLTDNVEEALSDFDMDDKEKNSFGKTVNATEDIAIESAENLLHVRKMLEKLQNSLNNMVEDSKKK